MAGIYREDSLYVKGKLAAKSGMLSGNMREGFTEGYHSPAV
jgi:hypothetical protein